MAVALQDHLMRNLSLSDPLRSHKVMTPKVKIKKEAKPIVDTGRNKPRLVKSSDKSEKEYVLDAKPAPLTLAQKIGLVEAPNQLLTESDWQKVKDASNKRQDSSQPCVICKDDFGLESQVLLSCSHVFHRACLQAFERFTGRKTCPMCRKEEYQTRVIHEGSRNHRHKCATRIQALWRGYVVRCWYTNLRMTVPPKDPKLRKKFYEEKFHSITERMVRSLDVDTAGFLAQMDQALEASRDVFKALDARLTIINDDEWVNIQIKAAKRCDQDCPICLNALQSLGLVDEVKMKMSENSVASSQNPTKDVVNREGHTKVISKRTHYTSTCCGLGDISKEKQKKIKRESVLLSCSHIFHRTCLEAFEDLAVGKRKYMCPVCRSHYQKKVI